MQLRHLLLTGLLAVTSNAQSSSDASSTTSAPSTTSSASVSDANTDTAIVSDTRSFVILTGSDVRQSSFTGTYATYTGQQTTISTGRIVSSTSTLSGSRSGASSGTGSTTASQGTTSTATILAGGLGLQTELVINGTVTTTLGSSAASSTASSSASSASTAALPVNTQGCNNYPELCSRKYSNITEVATHNAAFSVTGNTFSNQALTVTQQLNDGVRMLQGQVHLVNGSMYNCHTSCDYLNVGLWQDELEEIAEWVRSHPYDVVTILVGNYDYAEVGNFTAPLQNSGLAPYLYVPPYVPMTKEDWPTLSELILNQQRVIVFMDYQANQFEIPYILDEFSQIWETPFSPTNNSFPCTIERPPTLQNETIAKRDYMYMANHNLNFDISFLGNNVLIPNTANLNISNAAGDEEGMLGATEADCTEMWDNPPNFLLVDFYNVGEGSVFEVAARANGLEYNGQCCGLVTTSGATSNLRMPSIQILGALVAGWVMLGLF